MTKLNQKKESKEKCGKTTPSVGVKISVGPSGLAPNDPQGKKTKSMEEKKQRKESSDIETTMGGVGNKMRCNRNRI